MHLGRATRKLLIPAALAAFLAAGFGLERAERFRSIREALRDPSVPTAMLNRGSLGRVLRHLRLVRPIVNDGRLHPPMEASKAPLDASLFQKKRMVGDSLYVANADWVEDLATQPELAIPEALPEQFRAGWPLIAIEVAERDLNGPKWGIFANYKGHGREWERQAAMAYYVDGRQVFATRAGVRLHGGKSREPGKRHSLRLHFREEYGATEFQPGLLFDSRCAPLRRLVVHADWPESHPFAGLLAFDMAERIGCVVPRTQPVLLVLNGKLQEGIFWLSEHVSRSAWENRVGHKDFLMHVVKAQREVKSFPAYHEFCNRVLKTPAPLDLAAFEGLADLDSLSAYVLAVVYGGVSDGFQGAAIRDQRAAKPRWAWINWDMDHGFWDVYGDGSRKTWQKESWEHVYKRQGDRNYALWRNRGDVRSVLFTRLMNDSPVYRARFIRYVVDMLNHRLTVAFMDGRIAHYEQLVRSRGQTDLAFAADYREFVRARPAILREGLQRLFDAGPVWRVEVRAPAGMPLRIDGFEAASPYVGHYFDGQEIVVEAPGVRLAENIHGDRVLEVPVAP